MLNLEVKYAVPPIQYAGFGMETMGDRIRRLRQAAKLTQPQLGAICGVSKSAVSQWEDSSTANIKLPQLTRLLRALHTDLEYLVYGPERRPPEDAQGQTRTPGTGSP